MGALTSSSYVFVGRPWELNSIESIDIFDSLGSNISVDVYNDKVVRILPILDEDNSEEWISNSTSFSCEGFTVQRIGFPLLNVSFDFEVSNARESWWLSPSPGYPYSLYLRWGILSEESLCEYTGPMWCDPYIDEEYIPSLGSYEYLPFYGYAHLSCFVRFSAIRAVMDFGSIYISVGWEFTFCYLLIILRCTYLRFCEGVCGFLLDSESISALSYFLVGLGCANLMCGAISHFDIDLKLNYLFAPHIGSEWVHSIVVLVGLNPSLESPLLNVSLRMNYLSSTNYLQDAFNVYSLGLSLNYATYVVENIGNSVSVLLGVVEGKYFFCQNIAYESDTLVLLGMGGLMSPDGSSLISVVSLFCLEENMCFSVVHETSGSISAMDLGFIPGVSSIFISSFGGIPFDLPYSSYKSDLVRRGWFYNGDSTRMEVLEWEVSYSEKESCSMLQALLSSVSELEGVNLLEDTEEYYFMFKLGTTSIYHWDYWESGNIIRIGSDAANAQIEPSLNKFSWELLVWYLERHIKFFTLYSSFVPLVRYSFSGGSLGSLAYLLGADDVTDFEYWKYSEISNACLYSWASFKFYSSFIVYQGHHWDDGAWYGDLVFPSLVFVETEGLYLNYIGESRYSFVAVSSYGEAECDSNILMALHACVLWSASLDLDESYWGFDDPMDFFSMLWNGEERIKLPYNWEMPNDPNADYVWDPNPSDVPDNDDPHFYENMNALDITSEKAEQSNELASAWMDTGLWWQHNAHRKLDCWGDHLWDGDFLLDEIYLMYGINPYNFEDWQEDLVAMCAPQLEVDAMSFSLTIQLNTLTLEKSYDVRDSRDDLYVHYEWCSLEEYMESVEVVDPFSIFYFVLSERAFSLDVSPYDFGDILEPFMECVHGHESFLTHLAWYVPVDEEYDEIDAIGAWGLLEAFTLFDIYMFSEYWWWQYVVTFEAEDGYNLPDDGFLSDLSTYTGDYIDYSISYSEYDELFFSGSSLFWFASNCWYLESVEYFFNIFESMVYDSIHWDYYDWFDADTIWWDLNAITDNIWYNMWVGLLMEEDAWVHDFGMICIDILMWVIVLCWSFMEPIVAFESSSSVCVWSLSPCFIDEFDYYDCVLEFVLLFSDDVIFCVNSCFFSLCWEQFFLLNAMFGVLVDDYYSIDVIGSSSNVLSLSSASISNGDVSFSLEGVYC